MNTEKYKKILEEDLSEVKRSLSELGIQNPEVSSDWIETGDNTDTPSADPNEVADRTEDYDERRATLATLETRFNDIQAALSKIDNGTYGVCEISGEEIEEDRLDANPAARTCKKHMNETL